MDSAHDKDMRLRMKENEEGRRPRDAGAGFGAEDVPHRRPQLVDAAVLEFGGRAARGLERPKAGPTGSPSRTKTKTDAHCDGRHTKK